jgi:hypothetical protein
MIKWLVTKALSNIRAETIAKVIYNNITMVYGSLKKPFSDNGRNLTEDVIKAYTTLLATKHRVTTSYYLKTNKIVKNFNGLLRNVLIKMLINQLIIL